MPRDLETEKATLESMAPLSKGSAGQQESTDSGQTPSIRPYVQVLNINDAESCLALENAAFPPSEAASKEKFEYRLTVCGEICLGLFTTISSDAPPLLRKASTASVGSIPETGKDRTSILVGHIIATKSNNKTVTDADMALPPNGGHSESGLTLALHSFAVLPEHQKKGLGTILLKSYLQRMQVAGIADRCALLSHQELVPFYESLGFVNLGKSEATYGGGGWYNLVFEFKKIGDHQPPGTAQLDRLEKGDGFEDDDDE